MSRRLLVALSLLALVFAGGCRHYCTNNLSQARRRGSRGVGAAAGLSIMSGGNGGGGAGVAALIVVLPLMAIGAAVDAAFPTYGVCDGRCCANQHRAGKASRCSCSKVCPCHTGKRYGDRRTGSERPEPHGPELEDKPYQWTPRFEVPAYLKPQASEGSRR